MSVLEAVMVIGTVIIIIVFVLSIDFRPNNNCVRSPYSFRPILTLVG